MIYSRNFLQFFELTKRDTLTTGPPCSLFIRLLNSPVQLFGVFISLELEEVRIASWQSQGSRMLVLDNESAQAARGSTRGITIAHVKREPELRPSVCSRPAPDNRRSDDGYALLLELLFPRFSIPHKVVNRFSVRVSLEPVITKRLQ